MPRLNIRGDWCGGVGGGTVTVNGIVRAQPAGGVCWKDANTIVYGKRVQTTPREIWATFEQNPFDGSPEKRVSDYAPSYNMEGGGGEWIAGNGGTPQFVYTSRGLKFVGEGQRTVAEDGSVIVTCPHFQDGPWGQGGHGLVLRRPTGELVKNMPEISTLDIHMPNERQGFYSAAFEHNILRTFGFDHQPVIAPPGAGYWPRMRRMPNGEWWLQYVTTYAGGVNRVNLHPYDSLMGYVVAIGTDAQPLTHQFRPDFMPSGASSILSAWCINEGESPSSIRFEHIDLTKERTDLSEPGDVTMPAPPKVPVVTVHGFDGLITPNGWDMTWDDGNGNITHLYVKDKGIVVEVFNSLGEKGNTGKYRQVIP